MARQGRLPLAALLAGLLAIALTACGGGEDSSSTLSNPAGQTADESADSAPGGDPTDGQSNAPGSFLVPGGDNSVQTFGKEASDAERLAASAVLESYMRARAGGDWPAACATLDKSTIDPLAERVGASSGGGPTSCSAALAALAEGTPASTRINTMTRPIGSLRVGEGRAFALFHGTEGIDYVVQMSKQGVAWKVAALAPFELS